MGRNSLRARLPIRFGLVLCALSAAGSGVGWSQARYKEDPSRHDVPKLEPADAPAGDYKLDPAHAYVIWSLKHYGGLSNPMLTFEESEAQYTWDPKHPEATKVTARIKTQSVHNPDKAFERRLGGPMGFRSYEASDDDHFQYIDFESTKIQWGPKNAQGQYTGKMTGGLTIFGITKPVTLDFVFNGFYTSPQGFRKSGFSAHGVVDRQQYGMNTIPSVGKDVDVRLELEFFLVGASGKQESICGPEGCLKKAEEDAKKAASGK